MESESFPIFDLPADHLVIDHIVKYLGIQGIFNLWKCLGGYVKVAEKLLTRLDYLDLARLSERCSDAFWRVIRENCCRLKKIELHRYVQLDENFMEILNNNPLLEELDISYCTVTYEGPYTFTLENLKRLKMSNSVPTPRFLQIIAERCRKLSSVDLSWINSLTRDTLEAFFRQMPQITEINVTSTKTKDENIYAVLNIIGNCCPNLEVLRLDLNQFQTLRVYSRVRIPRIPETNHTLFSIAKGCQKIRHIIFLTNDIPSLQLKNLLRDLLGANVKFSFTRGLILTTYSYYERLSLVERLY